MRVSASNRLRFQNQQGADFVVCSTRLQPAPSEELSLFEKPEPWHHSSAEDLGPKNNSGKQHCQPTSGHCGSSFTGKNCRTCLVITVLTRLIARCSHSTSLTRVFTQLHHSMVLSKNNFRVLSNIKFETTFFKPPNACKNLTTQSKLPIMAELGPTCI